MLMLEIYYFKKNISLVKSSLIQGPDSRVDLFKISFCSCTMLYVVMQVQPTMSWEYWLWMSALLLMLSSSAHFCLGSLALLTVQSSMEVTQPTWTYHTLYIMHAYLKHSIWYFLPISCIGYFLCLCKVAFACTLLTVQSCLALLNSLATLPQHDNCTPQIFSWIHEKFVPRKFPVTQSTNLASCLGTLWG